MHVIVLGAGASGLAAARRLHDAGVTVQVLEARQRIGRSCVSSQAKRPHATAKRKRCPGDAIKREGAQDRRKAISYQNKVVFSILSLRLDRGNYGMICMQT